MSFDLGKGLRSVSEAQSAIISYNVTEAAKTQLEKEAAELEQGANI